MYFCVSDDATSPHILISYAMSEHLEIFEFKVPNLVAQSHIDMATFPSPSTPGDLRKTAKKVNFWEPLEFQPHCTPPPYSMRKMTKMVHFKDPIAYTIPQRPALPSSTQPKPALKTSTSSGPEHSLTEATNPSIAVAQDIVALKQAFPHSFDTIGNMPCTATIRTNPSVPLVQHVQREGTHRVPRADRMNTQQHGHLRSHSPCIWAYQVGIFLAYPHKPDGSLHISLNPKDLNKTIM